MPSFLLFNTYLLDLFELFKDSHVLLASYDDKYFLQIDT